MQGKATIAGHPIHPPLVAIPIGCFTAAIVCDIISIWAGPAFWAPMSVCLIGFGLIGALLAALFGFIDYLSVKMTARAQKIASWHLMLNIAVIVIFGMALALRAGDHTSPPGYVLTVLGIVLLGVSGWLGGALVSQHLVGSSERDASILKQPPVEEGG